MSATVLVSLSLLLLSCARSVDTTATTASAAAVVDDGETVEAEAACRDVCRLTTAVFDQESGVACKTFARALPYPKMGRMCTRKFRQGHDFACSELCYRLVRGDSDHIRPWIERLTHSACQDVSGDIPYPAVFNACKRGYSQGLTAACASMPKRVEPMLIGGGSDDKEKEKNSDDGEPSTGEEQRHAADPQHREDATLMKDDTDAENIVERKPLLAGKESVATVVPDGDRQAWVEALGVELEYVDYSTVAQKRVSDARRVRGSDLHRGPACPVCGG